MLRSSNAAPHRHRAVLVVCALAAGLALVTLALVFSRSARAQPTSPPLQRSAAEVIPARYASLGPIGHWLPDDLDRRPAPGIAWVREK